MTVCPNCKKDIDPLDSADKIDYHKYGYCRELNLTEKCKNCNGRGWNMGDDLVGTYSELSCEDCNGVGRVG